METKKDGLSIPKAAKSLDEFLTGKPSSSKEDFTWQGNIRFTEEEERLIKQGHQDCLEKMPMYQYWKKAILEKAAKDSKKRLQLNQVIQDLEE